MIKRILAVAVSAGLLAWLLADGRWRGIGEVFMRLDGLTLGLAVAGFMLSYLLRALRVRNRRPEPAACARTALSMLA